MLVNLSRWRATTAHALLICAAGAFGLGALPANAQPSAPDSAAVASTIGAFHAALARGDGEAAMRLLAPDAVILEGGGRESREEYRAHHLAADIEFAQAVPSKRLAPAVRVSGDTAWVSSTSNTRGTFRGRKLNLEGAELAILSRTDSGWIIRAIHWSSQASGSSD